MPLINYWQESEDTDLYQLILLPAICEWCSAPKVLIGAHLDFIILPSTIFSPWVASQWTLHHLLLPLDHQAWCRVYGSPLCRPSRLPLVLSSGSAELQECSDALRATDRSAPDYTNCPAGWSTRGPERKRKTHVSVTHQQENRGRMFIQRKAFRLETFNIHLVNCRSTTLGQSTLRGSGGGMPSWDGVIESRLLSSTSHSFMPAKKK